MASNEDQSRSTSPMETGSIENESNGEYRESILRVSDLGSTSGIQRRNLRRIASESDCSEPINRNEVTGGDSPVSADGSIHSSDWGQSDSESMPCETYDQWDLDADRREKEAKGDSEIGGAQGISAQEICRAPIAITGLVEPAKRDPFRIYSKRTAVNASLEIRGIRTNPVESIRDPSIISATAAHSQPGPVPADNVVGELDGSGADGYRVRRFEMFGTVHTLRSIKDTTAWLQTFVNGKGDSTFNHVTIAVEFAPETGSRHLHFYLEFAKLGKWRPDYPNSIFKEFFGNVPNWKCVWNLRKLLAYISKDGPATEVGPRRKKIEMNLNEVLRAGIVECKTERDFQTRIWQHDPRYAVQQGNNLSRAYYMHSQPTGPYVSECKFEFENCHPVFVTWVKSIGPRRTKCLCIIGPTRLGKTELVRWKFPNAIYMRNQINEPKLLRVDSTSEVYIYDDIDWSTMKWKAKALLTQMGQQDITGKYLGKLEVNISLPAIYLMNEANWLDIQADREFDRYWKENITVYQVTQPTWYNFRTIAWAAAESISDSREICMIANCVLDHNHSYII